MTDRDTTALDQNMTALIAALVEEVRRANLEGFDDANLAFAAEATSMNQLLTRLVGLAHDRTALTTVVDGFWSRMNPGVASSKGTLDAIAQGKGPGTAPLTRQDISGDPPVLAQGAVGGTGASNQNPFPEGSFMWQQFELGRVDGDGNPIVPDEAEPTSVLRDPRSVIGFPTARDPETGLLISPALPEPPDFSAQRLLPQSDRFQTLQGAFLQTSDEFYMEGEQWQLFSHLTTTAKSELQRQMVAAGLLTADKFADGTWDLASADAMHDLLELSNGNGRTWQNMLTVLRRNPVPGPDAPRGPVTPFVYLAPDYATLSQQVKSTFAQKLGRRPEDWEVTTLARFMDRQHSKAGSAQLSAVRLRDANHDIDETSRVGSVRQVDPVARMLEHFEGLYGPEIDRNERVDQVRANSQSMMASITGIDRLVEG